MIVTGMSGAGKTGALKCLEDMGYYAIDNLPATLLTNIVDIAPIHGKKLERVAVVMDVRGGTEFEDLFKALEGLESVPYTIVFLDASNDVLLKRFSETRRIHPLDGAGLRVTDTIEQERRVLQPLRERADVVIDTSSLNIYELREKLRLVVPDLRDIRMTRLTFISFGYKYGHPLDADIVFDVRFLPNPYWVEGMRDLDGHDDSVIEYVLEQPETVEFINRFDGLLELILPSYQRERRPYLTIAIGCTGGKHRSVVITDTMAASFLARGFATSVIHRDISKK
ncbi:MAG TPA: RNase adapter RapZ [Candidatus Anoxymicrobiaceae bacterium]